MPEPTEPKVFSLDAQGVQEAYDQFVGWFAEAAYLRVQAEDLQARATAREQQARPTVESFRRNLGAAALPPEVTMTAFALSQGPANSKELKTFRERAIDIDKQVRKSPGQTIIWFSKEWDFVSHSMRKGSVHIAYDYLNFGVLPAGAAATISEQGSLQIPVYHEASVACPSMASILATIGEDEEPFPADSPAPDREQSEQPDIALIDVGSITRHPGTSVEFITIGDLMGGQSLRTFTAYIGTKAVAKALQSNKRKASREELLALHAEIIKTSTLF